MREVIIDIKGTQGIGSETEVIEFSTVGKIKKTDGGYTLLYDEGEITGSKNSTSLEVKDQSTVVLERTGETSSKLIIQKGIRNNCFYSTPYGNLMIGIFGEEIKNELKDNGGSLKMSYTIDQNLQPISRNIVEIAVREVQ